MEKDLAGACKALLGAGYQPDKSIAESLALSHHMAFLHASRPRVELHFRLSHRTLGIPVDRFFDRTLPWRLPGGREARLLGPADQLMHLVLHLAHSHFGTLFHLYEIRRVCRAESPGVLAEAVRRAIDHHFGGVLRMTDIAFRTRFNEPFLPPEVSVPATWLNWRLNEKLYRAFELCSAPDRELTLATLFWGRWLEFQVTDGPSDALRSMKLLAQSARFRIAEGAWRASTKLVYGPRFPAQ
jgi:hypothetical protein